jgi:hypothetical protein
VNTLRVVHVRGKTLVKAIQTAFQKRGIDHPIEGLPVVFTSEFYDDVNKKRL